MNAKNDFSARLRAAMKNAGMPISGTELERAFNRKWDQTPVTVQAVSRWIRGDAMPRHDTLQVLAKVLRVDPNHLLFGTLLPQSAAERRREWDERATYAERETIEAFLRLPRAQRLLVRDVIATYAQVYGAIEPGKE